MQTSKIAAAVAVLTLAIPMVGQKTITCSSIHGKDRFCPANTKNGVMLVQERSDGLCEQGSTWSYTRRGISVKGGCSADFQVGGQAGSNANDSRNNGNDSNSYGNNSYNNGNRTNGQYNGNDQTRGNGNTNPNNNQYPAQNTNNNQYPAQNNRDGQRDSGSSNSGYRQQQAVVIPTGAQFVVRLEQRVSVADVQQGDIVPATLVNDVSVNGQVVAPSGTPVQAKVASAHGSPLDVRLESMTANGQTYRLVSNSIHSMRDSQASQNGNNQTASQEIGSLLGSLGGAAQLPSGSVYTFRLTGPARATPANQ